MLHSIRHPHIVIFLLWMSMTVVHGQVVINEASNRNASTLADEDGDWEDWLELYNPGAAAVDLTGWTLSDNLSEPAMWHLPAMYMESGAFLTVFASGKDRVPGVAIDHWETAVGANTIWKYTIPDASTSAEWLEPGFSPAGWNSGKASIGYGDGDDSTLVPAGTISVYLRYNFTIDDLSRIGAAVFHCDYDDGFVAYLNGTMIAQFGFPGGFPAWNATTATDRESTMYSGGMPDAFLLDPSLFDALLVEGDNVLAVEVHNVNVGSRDLTIRPFLSFGFTDPLVTYEPIPAWFEPGDINTQLHTNFRISTSGETLYIFDSLAVLIDSLWVGGLSTDHSIGNTTDGAATESIFSIPTPGASNNTSVAYSGYAPRPEFSLAAGFYGGPVKTAITCPLPGYEIYLRSDGNIPDEGDFLYTDSVNITSTRSIRAICYRPDDTLLSSLPATRTYFINEVSNLPVFSITTEEDNLYGPEGIYDNWWTDWKRSTYIEYFDSTHTYVLGQYAGIKLEGGAGGSRSLPQKSFRLEPDHPSFGEGLIHYPLIPRAGDVSTYETFYLRNGSNMWNVLPYKDAYMVRCLEGTYNDFMAYDPVEVWLNGEYWGLYELREKLDEGHYKYAHLVDKDDLDLLSMSYWYGLVLRTLQGSDTAWHNMIDYIYSYPTPEDDVFLDLAGEKLDLEAFADYMIGETWMGNTDWPWNNMKIWRDRGGDNLWKYAVIDLEWGLGYGWTWEGSDMINYIVNEYNYYTSPFLTLIENPVYHDYFINRYADLMNTTFQVERLLAIEDVIYDKVVEALPRQLNRWGDGSPIPSQMAVFEDYRNALLEDFEVRSDYVRNHIEWNFDLDGQVNLTLEVVPPEAGRIHISTLKIYDTPWSGIYFNGVPVNVIAEAATGFTFSHWGTDPLIPDTLAEGMLVNFTDDAFLTAYFTGSPQPEEIIISEVNYHSEDSRDAGDWLELHNAGDYTVDISGWEIKDQQPLHSFVIPEDTYLEPGAFLVIANNLEKFTSQHPDVTNYIGSLGFSLSNDAEVITLLNDREVVMYAMSYTDSHPWPVGADGEGRTLEYGSDGMDPSLPEAWFDGCIGGSPGTAYAPCMDAIVVSEINYNSDPAFDTDDWIELRNNSGSTMDLSGWLFANSNAAEMEWFTLPDGSELMPGEHLVIAQTQWQFEFLQDTVPVVPGSFFFGLDGGNDWLRLYDAAGILQVSVHYRDDSGWPELADGLGYTLELVDAAGKMNDPLNWIAGCYGGSPNQYISLPCADEVAIENIEKENIQVYPNPASRSIFLASDGAAGLSGFTVYNSVGAVMYTSNQALLPLQEIDISLWPAGTYWLVTHGGGAAYFVKAE